MTVNIRRGPLCSTSTFAPGFGRRPLAQPDPRPARAQSLVEQRWQCYCDPMTLKARVKAGRLVVDEPTELPEGTEIELLSLDPGDWLDAASRALLRKALLDSEEDVNAGRSID